MNFDFGDGSCRGTGQLLTGTTQTCREGHPSPLKSYPQKQKGTETNVVETICFAGVGSDFSLVGTGWHSFNIKMQSFNDFWERRPIQVACLILCKEPEPGAEAETSDTGFGQKFRLLAAPAPAPNGSGAADRDKWFKR